MHGESLLHPDQGVPKVHPIGAPDRIKARLEKSTFFGKYVGRERKLTNGDFARYRFDYEPDLVEPRTGRLLKRGREAHYNVELSVHVTGRELRKNYAYSVDLLCAGHICSQAEAMALIKVINR